jgi:hypothetical protein
MIMPSITHAAANYKNFEVALYVRVYEVQQMKDVNWLETRWNVLSQQMKFGKLQELLSGREFPGRPRGETRVFETYLGLHSYSVFAAEPAP